MAEDLIVIGTQHQTPISTLLLFLLSFKLISMELRHLQTTRTEDSALIIINLVASYLEGAKASVSSVVLITAYAEFIVLDTSHGHRYYLCVLYGGVCMLNIIILIFFICLFTCNVGDCALSAG